MNKHSRPFVISCLNCFLCLLFFTTGHASILSLFVVLFCHCSIIYLYWYDKQKKGKARQTVKNALDFISTGAILTTETHDELWEVAVDAELTSDEFRDFAAIIPLRQKNLRHSR